MNDFWIYIKNDEGKIIYYLNTVNITDVKRCGSSIDVTYTNGNNKVYDITIEQFRTALLEG